MSSLSDKLHRKLAEAQMQVLALTDFPDLEELKDRWGRLYLTSKTVNKNATLFEVRNQCDCCNKVPVYFLPYIQYGPIRIYSRPIEFRFALRHNRTILSDNEWDEDLDLNNTLIQNVNIWLDEYENGDLI